uniref:Methylene-tetrahydrofolate reductase C-terminal-like domain-containing protein n=1 Tax=Desulfobacca acetoxidans TaxID=60893 RepID=A0A7V6A2Y8_9BACT
MIVGTRKPLAEIQDMVKKYDRLLLAGCDTCVAECASGGRREVAELAAALQMAFRLAGKEMAIREASVDRQCVHEFLLEVVEAAQEADAVLSLACGAGVQALADRLPDTPVFPALNTLFIGETAERGLWLENCRGCGNCMLGITGGICPVSRCAKSLLNGPCGGARNGLCEINLAKELVPEVPCAWLQIYDRLSALGELDRLVELTPPKDWSCGDASGPRRVVRSDQQG